MCFIAFRDLHLVHPCDLKTKGGCTDICMKNEEEEENGLGYTCKCPPGSKLQPDQKSCKKVHPCDTIDNGGCTDICQKNGEKVVCACKKGLKLMNKVKCVPVHPCETKDKGGCSHTCNVGDGDEVRCSCPQGSLLEEDMKTCEKGNV